MIKKILSPLLTAAILAGAFATVGTIVRLTRRSKAPRARTMRPLASVKNTRASTGKEDVGRAGLRPVALNGRLASQRAASPGGEPTKATAQTPRAHRAGPPNPRVHRSPGRALPPPRLSRAPAARDPCALRAQSRGGLARGTPPAARVGICNRDPRRSSWVWAGRCIRFTMWRTSADREAPRRGAQGAPVRSRDDWRRCPRRCGRSSRLLPSCRARRPRPPEAGSSPPVKVAPKPAAPPPEAAPAWLRDYMLAQSALVLEVMEHAPVVLLLIYFLLASGEHFRRKLTKVVGPSRERKKDAVRILEEIDLQVQRYLLVTLVTNVIIAVVTGLVFAALGMEHAAGWGMAAGVLHFIPYLGEGALRGCEPGGCIHPVWIGHGSIHRHGIGIPAVICHRPVLPDVASQQGRAGQCRGALHRAAVLWVALGHVGPASRRAAGRHRQGGLRPGRVAQARRGVHGTLSGGPARERSGPSAVNIREGCYCCPPAHRDFYNFYKLKLSGPNIIDRLRGLAARVHRSDPLGKYSDPLGKYAAAEPPLRLELFNADQMERHGRHLALAHRRRPGRSRDRLPRPARRQLRCAPRRLWPAGGAAVVEPAHHSRRRLAPR